MMIELFLLAQVECGTYGASPSSPGGCKVGDVYLQEYNGQIIRQEQYRAPAPFPEPETSPPSFYSPAP